jgi:hypothetical protein
MEQRKVSPSGTSMLLPTISRSSHSGEKLCICNGFVYVNENPQIVLDIFHVNHLAPLPNSQNVVGL